MASFSVLTAFWFIKTSQVKEKSKEENRVKKIEDSSYSLPSNFWSTFRSPFSTYYIPFQRSGSQNPTLQIVYDLELKWGRYGLRKTTTPCMCEFRTTHHACANFAQQPMHVRISHNQPSMCEFRTSPCVFGAKCPMFYRLHIRSFLLYFFDVNSFLIPVTSQSQALLL